MPKGLKYENDYLVSGCLTSRLWSSRRVSSGSA